MEINGKVFKVLPAETGEGKNGPWKKQQVVLETDNGRFPKKIAIQFWGDLVNNDAFTEGNDLSVEFDIESREFNGKWYTDVKAWRINKSTGNTPPPANRDTARNAAANTAPAYTASDIPPAQIEDDLPF